MLSVQDGVIYITHGDYAQTPPFKIIGQDDEGHERKPCADSDRIDGRHI